MRARLRPLTLYAAVVLPGVGPVDPRVAIDPTATPWRAIGRVQTELGGRCSGFLVGKRTVLTAAHCLYRRAAAGFVQPSSVHFLLGYDRGSYAAHARATAFTIGDGWDPRRESTTLGADWAALCLDTPIGTPGRVLTLGASVPVPGRAVELGGYGQDRAERIDADLHCSVTRLGLDAGRRPLIEHNCSGTSGTSGAPLLQQGPDGWMAVGVQVAAVRGRAQGLAVAATGIRLPHQPGS